MLLEFNGRAFDNNNQFINHDVTGWVTGMKIFFKGSRP